MIMKELFLEVVTPSKTAYSGDIKSVSVPGTLGNFQVLFNHAPILSSMEIGIVKIVDDEGKEFEYSTSGGTIEVLNNKVLLLAESFESPDEIDARRAEEAEQRAKELLSRKNKADIDLDRAELALHRSINRLKLKKKYL
jgi:F-type H+-transporting ATPase subunit epsilon